MSEVKRAHRLEALLIWANRATGAGHPVPTADELDDIATNPDAYLDRMDSLVVKAWSNTIDELLHQTRFGVSPAAANDGLLDELKRPTMEIVPPEPNPRIAPSNPNVTLTSTPQTESDSTAHQSVSDPVMTALLSWRTQRIADGADGAELIKEMTLEKAVKDSWTADQIARNLPGTARYLGPEIAEIIASFAGGPPPRPRSSGPDPSVRTTPTAASQEPSGAAQIRRAPTARHAAPSAPPREEVTLDLTHRDFDPLDWANPAPALATINPISVKPVDEGLRLSFDAYVPEVGKTVIYRVVSSDAGGILKPEEGDLIDATTALSVYDGRPLSCAVRSYQVWCNVGSDDEDARRNQPFLLAQGEEVSPVNDFSLIEAEGRVSSEWWVFPGTQKVQVYRVLLENVSDAATGVLDPKDRICEDKPNLRGFVDTAATPGSRYLYSVLAEVNDGSASRLSRAKRRDIEVSVVLAPVDDLDVTLTKDDGSEFDVTWTRPAIGDVRVYRMSQPPSPSLRDQTDLTMSALQREMLFAEENRVRYPVETLDAERDQITRVPWPSSWDRAYLTAVTVLEDKVRVGTTKVETRPLPPVRDVQIVERFDTEMVKFSWPAGAANVLVFVGSTTATPEEICARAKFDVEISRSRHSRDGGYAFDRQLEPKGCKVCLVPVHYSGAQRVRGRITELTYPGLHRMHYNLVPVEAPGRIIRQVRISHDLELDSAIGFVMVHRTERFPLSVDDGEALYFRPPQGGEASTHCHFYDGLTRGAHLTGWTTDLTNVRGFVRLFIGSQGDESKRFALGDPSIRELFITDPPVDGAK